MTRIRFAKAAWLLWCSCLASPVLAGSEGAGGPGERPVASGAPAGAATLPPAEDAAKARLNASPRHGEFASIDVKGTPVRVWVVYPERKDKAPAVLVIHEIFGLTDWIRSVADQLAADGFIAVVPDLLSGKGPNGGGTEAYPDRDEVISAVSGLSRDEVIARLNEVRKYATSLPAASGKSATVGFCWGGSTSFAYAVAQPELDAAVVYYGTAPPDLSTLATVKAPVLGLYGGNDARVDTTIEATAAKMKELGKVYEPHVFDGAGHGFLRAQDAQDGANSRAARQAWPMTIAFLRKYAK
jgi:carboxymethylenebutenolidase